MADINIFEDEKFSVSTLTAAINELQSVPGRISQMGLYSEEGVSTTVVQIEYDGQTLGLVSAKPRGGVGQSVGLAGRKLIPFNTVHLPQRSTMLADEIQGIRAFGSQSELEVAEARVAKYQGKHRQQLDLKRGVYVGWSIANSTGFTSAPCVPVLRQTPAGKC